jgi:hypothetical protein
MEVKLSRGDFDRLGIPLEKMTTGCLGPLSRKVTVVLSDGELSQYFDENRDVETPEVAGIKGRIRLGIIRKKRKDLFTQILQVFSKNINVVFSSKELKERLVDFREGRCSAEEVKKLVRGLDYYKADLKPVVEDSLRLLEQLEVFLGTDSLARMFELKVSLEGVLHNLSRDVCSVRKKQVERQYNACVWPGEEVEIRGLFQRALAQEGVDDCLEELSKVERKIHRTAKKMSGELVRKSTAFSMLIRSVKDREKQNAWIIKYSRICASGLTFFDQIAAGALEELDKLRFELIADVKTDIDRGLDVVDLAGILSNIEKGLGIPYDDEGLILEVRSRATEAFVQKMQSGDLGEALELLKACGGYLNAISEDGRTLYSLLPLDGAEDIFNELIAQNICAGDDDIARFIQNNKCEQALRALDVLVEFPGGGLEEKEEEDLKAADNLLSLKTDIGRLRGKIDGDVEESMEFVLGVVSKLTLLADKHHLLSQSTSVINKLTGDLEIVLAVQLEKISKSIRDKFLKRLNEKKEELVEPDLNQLAEVNPWFKKIEAMRKWVTNSLKRDIIKGTRLTAVLEEDVGQFEAYLSEREGRVAEVQKEKLMFAIGIKDKGEIQKIRDAGIKLDRDIVKHAMASGDLEIVLMLCNTKLTENSHDVFRERIEGARQVLIRQMKVLSKTKLLELGEEEGSLILGLRQEFRDFIKVSKSVSPEHIEDMETLYGQLSSKIGEIEDAVKVQVERTSTELTNRSRAITEDPTLSTEEACESKRKEHVEFLDKFRFLNIDDIVRKFNREIEFCKKRLLEERKDLAIGEATELLEKSMVFVRSEPVRGTGIDLELLVSAQEAMNKAIVDKTIIGTISRLKVGLQEVITQTQRQIIQVLQAQLIVSADASITALECREFRDERLAFLAQFKEVLPPGDYDKIVTKFTSEVNALIARKQNPDLQRLDAALLGNNIDDVFDVLSLLEDNPEGPLGVSSRIVIEEQTLAFIDEHSSIFGVMPLDIKALLGRIGELKAFAARPDAGKVLDYFVAQRRIVEKSILDRVQPTVQQSARTLEKCFKERSRRGLSIVVEEFKKLNKLQEALPDEGVLGLLRVRIRSLVDPFKVARDGHSLVDYALEMGHSDLAMQLVESVALSSDRIVSVGDSVLETMKKQLRGLQKPAVDIDRWSLAESSDYGEVNAGVCGHVLGDVFLKSTSLEGYVQRDMVAHVHRFLDRHREPQWADVTTVLDRGSDIYRQICSPVYPHDLSDNMSRTLDGLPLGGSMLLPGGWSGKKSGHAIYYEITKQDDGNFYVRICNSGSGLGYHAAISAWGETFHSPYVEIGDVSKEKLCSELFLSVMWELRNHIEDDAGTDICYGPKDIYERVVHCLGGKEKPGPTEIHKYIEAQHSGTCTWSSLKAWLRTRLSREAFITLNYQISLETLVGFYKTSKREGHRSEKNRLLLQKGAEQFMRDALEARSLGCITAEQLTQAYATAHDIMRRIKVAEQVHEHDKYAMVSLGDVRESWRGKGFRACLERVSASRITLRGMFKPAIPCWRSSMSPVKSAAELQGVYDQCCRMVGKRYSENTVEALHAINEVFKALPLPGDGFWGEVPDKDIVLCMEYISKLSELGVRLGCITGLSKHTMMAHQFSMFKGMMLLQRLAIASGKIEGVEHWRMPVSHFLNIFGLLGGGIPRGDAIIFDADMRHQLTSLEQWYHGTAGGAQVFTYASTQEISVDRDSEGLLPRAELEFIKQFLPDPHPFSEHYFPDAVAARFLLDTELRKSKMPSLPHEFDCLQRHALMVDWLIQTDRAYDRIAYFAQIEGETFSISETEGSSLIRCKLKVLEAPSSEGTRGVMEGLLRFKKETPPDVYVRPENQGKYIKASCPEGRYKHLVKHPEVDLGQPSRSAYAAIWDRAKRLGLSQEKVILDLDRRETSSLDAMVEEGLAQVFTEDHHLTGSDVAGEYEILQIPKLISYFSGSLSYLSDYGQQALFKRALFEDDLISKILDIRPEYVVNIASFINRGLEQYKDEENTQAYCFFYSTSCSFEC